MRKVIVLAIVLLVNVLVFAQKESVQKIGHFNLYDSIDELDKLALGEVFLIKSNADLLKQTLKMTRKNLVFEYVYDATAKGKLPDWGMRNVYQNKNVRRFCIFNHELIKGIELDGVQLIYLHDSLVSIRTFSILKADKDIITLKQLFEQKYEPLVLDFNGLKPYNAYLERTQIIKDTYFKAENKNVVCAFLCPVTKNTVGNYISDSFGLVFEDMEKMKEVQRIEKELETKKLLNTYDVNQL